MSRKLCAGYFEGEAIYEQRMVRDKSTSTPPVAGDDDMSTEDFHAVLSTSHGQTAGIAPTAGTVNTVTKAGIFTDALGASKSYAGVFLALKAGPNYKRTIPKYGSFIKSNTDDIATLERTFGDALDTDTRFSLFEGGVRVRSPLGFKFKVEFFDGSGDPVAGGSCDVYIDRCDRMTGDWEYGYVKHIGSAPQHGVWQVVDKPANDIFRPYIKNISGAAIASVRITMEAIR